MRLKIFFRTQIVVLLCFGGQLYAQNGYVQQDVIKVAGITSDQQIPGLSLTQKETSKTYVDGLGRPIQQVAQQASPLQNDLVQPIAYDNLGRQTKSYLPYAGKSTDVVGSYRANAIATEQPAFYNNGTADKVADDGSPFSQQVFENSPLQRTLQAGTIGTGFQPVSGNHYKTVSYRFNNGGDGFILIWNADGTFTTGTYYASNALGVTDGKDEDNTETLSFTDLAGRVILKRQILSSGNLDTYYVYNYAGMLSYIIPPLAVNKLAANSYNLNIAPLKNLVFHYVYNTRGRLVEKTVPGQGKMFIVYDPYNRPVLMQDSNMRVSNQWNYIKYDVEGRAVSQGIYTNTTQVGRTAMQSWINTNYGANWYEIRSTNSPSGYYTNGVFPSTGIAPLAYAYYDDYDVDNNGTPNFSYIAQGLAGEGTATTAALKGVPTVISQATIGNGITAGTWISKATFYDKRGNPIQTQSNNHLYNTGILTLTDLNTTVPDFTGVPQISKVSKQTGASTTTTVQTSFSYDHRNRITSVSLAYNGGASTQVAAYTYNELGQLIKKSLGQVSGSTYLQNVDMRYNIRGQLLSINNSKLSNDAGVTNGDTNDLFGMQFLYDQTDANLGNTAYYNGKLSAVKWMSKDGSGNSSYERAFRYYYDALNRDTAAVYAERTTASTSAFATTHGWDEDRISYDQNGNILGLYRNSATQGTGSHTGIDNLTYTYSSTNPNQLLTVTDGTTASYIGAGFRNLTGSTGSYTYDGNGNLASDPYKGFFAITHNVINRTEKIYFSSPSNRSIDYSYSVDGTLLRKRQYDNIGGVVTLQATTDYIDGFVYLNGTLQYFGMPEGRVLNNGGTLSREYTIADQQGNVRITFDNTGADGTAKVRQENSYYAFGLIMPGSTVATPTNDNKNLYNGGSEWQNDFGNLPDYYQTFFRNYDAALARFVAVDPKADGAESMSVYHYAGNNPIMGNDPMGDLARFRLASQDIPDPAGNAWGSLGAPLGSGGNHGDFDVFSVGNIFFSNGNGSGSSNDWGAAYQDQSKGTLISEARAGDVNALAELGARYGTSYIWNPYASSTTSIVASNSQATNFGVNASFTGAWAEKANQEVMTHDQELAKYGKITFAVNFNASFAAAIFGEGYEYGTIGTDKGWRQDYKTIYPVIVGFNLSATFNHEVIFSKNATFSDWAGSYHGVSFGYGYGSVQAGYSSNYAVVGLGIGLGWGPKLLKNYNGSGQYGITTLVGKPYLDPAVDAPITTMYFNEIR